MKIAGLQRVTLIDYPDRLAATLFVAGCNLDCPYCHNRWMIDASGADDTSSAPEALSVEELLAWLATRRGLLDGICVSGGEPTLAPDLPDLLRRIKGMGFAVKLDTNGTRPEVLERLLGEGLLDMVAMDLKAPLDARYSLVAGRSVDVQAVRRSMAALRAWGGEYEFRTTVAPPLKVPWLRDMARVLLPEERWYLQAFRAAEGVDPAYSADGAPDEGALRTLVEELRGLAPGARLRALDV